MLWAYDADDHRKGLLEVLTASGQELKIASAVNMGNPLLDPS